MLSRFLQTTAGDSLSFRLVLRGSTAPLDLTPISFTGGVRVPNTTENLVDFNFDILGMPRGVVRVFLAPDQTKRLGGSERLYEWHVTLEDRNYTKTLGGGALKVDSK